MSWNIQHCAVVETTQFHSERSFQETFQEMEHAAFDTSFYSTTVDPDSSHHLNLSFQGSLQDFQNTASDKNFSINEVLFI